MKKLSFIVLSLFLLICFTSCAGSKNALVLNSDSETSGSTIDETQAEKKSQLSRKKGYGSMNKRSKISDKKKSGNQ